MKLSPRDLERCEEIIRGKRGICAETVRAVSDATGIPVREIMGRGRTAAVAHARQLVYYLCRQNGMTLCQIGREMRRDHTTVHHGIREEAKRRGEA